MSFKNEEGMRYDVKAVSEMLGHAGVGITLKIYRHVNAKTTRQIHREYSPLKELTTIDTPARTQLTESLSL